MAGINRIYVPKFDYPEIEATTTDCGRIYHTPDGDMSSLTTMLSATKDMSSLERWRDRIGHPEADKITKEAGEKGTQVHHIMEVLLRGEDITDIYNSASELVRQGYNSLKLYVDNITEIYGLEVALYDTELEIAGRSDVIGCWQHRPAIIDWKTSRKKKRPEWIVDYKLQLLYYSMAHNIMFGTNIMFGVILIAVENDLPQIFEVDFEKEDWLWTELANRIDMFRQSGAHQKLVEYVKNHKGEFECS